MKISLILVCIFVLVPFAFGDLQVGFYNSTCSRAESIVQQVVLKRFSSDNSITAALLQMHFHDCFVRGCDASILIDSTANNSEKHAGPNEGVRGYDLIDEIKESLEAACPSTVSCADIVTLATRDAVALSGGPRYEVPTGRRDGLESDANEVRFPGPGTPVFPMSQFFARKGITTQEMVTLFGAHTVGVAHCSFFKGRLSSSGKPHPTMDPALDAELVKLCAPTRGKEDPAASLDQGTRFLFDNQFYKQIILNRGILPIDQELALDNSTSGFVSGFASDGDQFGKSFADAMIKMGNIEVLVGNAGEVRKNCRVFNERS